MSTRSAEIAEEIRQLVADSAAADEKAASRHALAEQSNREAETLESAASELTSRGVRYNNLRLCLGFLRVSFRSLISPTCARTRRRSGVSTLCKTS